MVFDRYKSKIEGKRWEKASVLQLYKSVFDVLSFLIRCLKPVKC